MVKTVLIIAILSLLIFSGCMGTSPTTSPTPTGTQEATSAPVLTPAATLIPTPVTTATPVSIKPVIKVTFYNTSVTGESNFTVQWEVSGGTPGDISRTAVLWGFKSGGENISDYSRESNVQTGKTPQLFDVELKSPSGGDSIYFRVHAIVDDVHIYSPEYKIIIIPLYTGAGGGGGGY